jgi:hypothetical protein
MHEISWLQKNFQDLQRRLEGCKGRGNGSLALVGCVPESFLFALLIFGLDQQLHRPSASPSGARAGIDFGASCHNSTARLPEQHAALSCRYHISASVVCSRAYASCCMEPFVIKYPLGVLEHEYRHSVVGVLRRRGSECVCHIVGRSFPEMDGEEGGFVAEKTGQARFLEIDEEPASTEL